MLNLHLVLGSEPWKSASAGGFPPAWQGAEKRNLWVSACYRNFFVACPDRIREANSAGLYCSKMGLDLQRRFVGGFDDFLCNVDAAVPGGATVLAKSRFSVLTSNDCRGMWRVGLGEPSKRS